MQSQDLPLRIEGTLLSGSVFKKSRAVVGFSENAYLNPIGSQNLEAFPAWRSSNFGVLFMIMELAACLTAWDPKRPVTLLANIVIDRLQRGVAGKLGKVAGGGLLMKALLLLAASCWLQDVVVWNYHPDLE
ncbi:hypothetical protein R1sor_007972 [Riccia sorocarpa]|uniref:Uncharacterized protein n=1 Tax=Riccia sorocarpa TaxID=122646 RepID=A0ABD3HTQ2_9MARC